MWVLLLCLGDAWLASTASVTVATTPQAPPTEDHTTQLVDWLLRYGYLPPPDPSSGQLQAWTTVTTAVRAMQKFAGLNDTGELDDETLALMRSPRCSLPDHPSGGPPNQEQTMRRRRRRAVSMWTRRNINWRLQSYPPSAALSRETVRSLVYYALRVWAEPTPLDFHEVGSPGVADLQVDFLHGHHGDGYPFDGVGGAVGHAFFPSDPLRAGGVHLDAEEDWAFRQPAAAGTDLFTVLLHELGHALGLSHSSSRHSVMRPYYQGPAGDPLHYRLGPQDLQHITQLYGKREQSMASDGPRVDPEIQMRRRDHPHSHHHHRAVIDRCNTTFDAVAKIRGETFFFKGWSMWRVGGLGLVSFRGAAVRRLWRALPSDLHLSAVLERQTDHAIIFISDSQVWLFRDLSLQDGYPAPLNSLRMGVRVEEEDQEEEEEGDRGGRQGLLWDPEEGTVWGDTGASTPGQEHDVWTRLLREEGVSGITTDNDGAVYLFSGASYWKFPFPGSAPEDGYPRPIAVDWLDCPEPGPYSETLPHLTSPKGGRQELREARAEGGGDEEVGGRKDGGLQSGEHVWTQCTCQSGAEVERTKDYVNVVLLCLWTIFVM